MSHPYVLCSGIIFGANEISMLTVDHFARDEHVSKTGKSACVRMDVCFSLFHSAHCVSASAQSEPPLDRIRADFNLSGLGTDHIAHKTRAKTARVILISKKK